MVVYYEFDFVIILVGDVVVMVYCNNGVSEFVVWVGLFICFVFVFGMLVSDDVVFDVLFCEVLVGEVDVGGLIVYNYFVGELIVGLIEGCLLFVCILDSVFIFVNVMCV